jgi:hypothetical protein
MGTHRDIHIGAAAKALGVTATYLRLLEKADRIPPARRDFNGRVYSEFDIALLKSMGVGSKPQSLKRPEEVLGA